MLRARRPTAPGLHWGVAVGHGGDRPSLELWWPGRAGPRCSGGVWGRSARRGEGSVESSAQPCSLTAPQHRGSVVFHNSPDPTVLWLYGLSGPSQPNRSVILWFFGRPGPPQPNRRMIPWFSGLPGPSQPNHSVVLWSSATLATQPFCESIVLWSSRTLPTKPSCDSLVLWPSRTFPSQLCCGSVVFQDPSNLTSL